MLRLLAFSTENVRGIYDISKRQEFAKAWTTVKPVIGVLAEMQKKLMGNGSRPGLG